MAKATSLWVFHRDAYRHKIELTLEKLGREAAHGELTDPHKYRLQLRKLIDKAVDEAESVSDHNDWLVG